MRGATSIFRKARDNTPRDSVGARAVEAELGSGLSLDGQVRARMETALRHDFSGVRVHTDAAAGHLSSDIRFRAFTVGGHVAFGQGEYQPGTIVGDAETTA